MRGATDYRNKAMRPPVTIWRTGQTKVAAYGENVMKSKKAAHGSMDTSNLSIPEAEEIIEQALNELAFSPDPGMARALQFLAPPGYQAIVELCGESGQ